MARSTQLPDQLRMKKKVIGKQKQIWMDEWMGGLMDGWIEV